MLKKEFIKKLRLKLKTNYPSWCTAPKQLGDNIEFFFSKNDSSFSIDFDTPSSGKDKYHIQINLYVKNNNLYNVKNSISSKFHKNTYFGNYNLMPNFAYQNDFFFNIHDTDDDYKIDNIISALNQYYYPVAYGLIFNYNLILEKIYDSNFLIGLQDRFTTLVIMAFYVDREDWIYDTFIPIIQENKLGENTQSIFYEYTNLKDPQAEILAPLKKWFKK